MLRGFIGSAALWGLLAAGLVPLAGPASAEPALDVGPTSRCVEDGTALELPSLRWWNADGPVVGREVRWEYGDDSRQLTESVTTDANGIARPPLVDHRIADATSVRVQVLGVGGFNTARFVRYRIAGKRIFDGSIGSHHDLRYSQRLGIGGSVPRTDGVGADGGCIEAPALGATITGWATDRATGQRTEIARTAVTSPEPTRGWRLSGYLPAVAEYRVTAEATYRGTTHPLGGLKDVSVERDAPLLDGGVVNASRFIEKGVVVSRVPRGDRHTLRISLNQDDWRPAVKGEPARVVEVRLRHITTGKVTRLPDVRLVRKGDRRVGDIGRTMRSSGRYELTFRGSVTDEPATHTFGVRLAPRISFPARTTRARAYRPVHRTVTIRDAKGLSAQLEHMTRNGWVPSGQPRRIPASGKVRLGSRNDTRNHRTHRVVVLQRYDSGVTGRAAVSKGTWKVLNR